MQYSYVMHQIAIANRFLVINSEISDMTNNTIVEAIDAHYFENIFLIKLDLIQV